MGKFVEIKNDGNIHGNIYGTIKGNTPANIKHPRLAMTSFGFLNSIDGFSPPWERPARCPLVVTVPAAKRLNHIESKFDQVC